MVEWVYGRERREKREGEMMELYYNVKKEKNLKTKPIYTHRLIQNIHMTIVNQVM